MKKFRTFDGIALTRRNPPEKLASAASASSRFPNVTALADHKERRLALAKFEAPVRYTKTNRVRMLETLQLDFDLITLQLRLSPGKPQYGTGHLYFYGALEYFAKDDRALMLMTRSTPGGYFVITIESTAPGSRYLFDLRLSGLTDPFVRSFDGTVVRLDANGHAIFVVTAGPDGRAALGAAVDGVSLYNFHDVTISKIS